MACTTVTVNQVRDNLFKLYPNFFTADPVVLAQIDAFIQIALDEACTCKLFALTLLSAYYIQFEQDGGGSGTAGAIIEEKNGDQTIKYSSGSSSSSSSSSKSKIDIHSDNNYGRLYDRLFLQNSCRAVPFVSNG